MVAGLRKDKHAVGPGLAGAGQAQEGGRENGVVVENKEVWAHWVQKNAHLMWLVGAREALVALSWGVA